LVYDKTVKEMTPTIYNDVKLPNGREKILMIVEIFDSYIVLKI